jgi:hypothetical protein
MTGRKDWSAWDGLSTDELLQRGIAAARIGEASEAEAYLTEVTVRDPQNADAWLWLASVEPNPQAKRQAFERVLSLRPEDAEAQAGLARLTDKYGQALLADEAELETLHCAWHPDRATMLRCARCARPICPSCAQKHPVGWRCKECARELRSPLYKVSPAGYVAAGAAGLVASIIAAVILGAIPFWILVVFIAAGVGALVAEVVSWASGRKRGRGLQALTAVCMAAGVAVALALSGAGVLPVPISLPSVLIYLLMGTGTAVARLR